MKVFDILQESKANIVEQHFKSSDILVESVCKDLTKNQKRIVEGIYKEFKPLIEASLTADQINKIFTDVEAGATAAGGNRTALGKAKDVPGKVNDVINKVGKWLQDTTPVKAMDAKFDKLKNDINQKFPDSKILDGVSKLGTWMKDNPGKSAAVIGVLTAIASLAGGPVGGAIAGQVLKGSAELIKGEKLSTAIGKGLKAAAVGWLAGKSMEAIGDMIKDVYGQFNPIPIDATRKYYEVNVGNGLPSTYQDATFYGSKEQYGQFKGMWGDAVKQWKGGNYEAAQAAFDKAREFAQQASDATLNQIAINGDPAEKLQQLDQALSGLAAAAQGAAAGATSYDKQGKPIKKESKDLSQHQLSTIFEWCNGSTSILSEGPLDWAKQKGKNLTTKITADKLHQAWKAAGSPTDSNQVADILRTAGVSDEVLAPVFKSMKIKLGPKGSAQQDSAQTTLDVKAIVSAIGTMRTRDLQSLAKHADQILGTAQPVAKPAPVTAKTKTAPASKPASATPTPAAKATPATNTVKVANKNRGRPAAKPAVAV